MEIVQQIASFQFFLGIDVSKESLVVHRLSAENSRSKAKSFKNDSEGIQELLKWLGDAAQSYRAVMEATSRYHRLCERTLMDAGVHVDLVNPRRARALAIGLGISDKNDRVDAKALAQAAQLLQLNELKVHSLKAQELRDHSRSIDTLKEAAGQFLKRLEGLDPHSRAFQACLEAAKTLQKLAAKEEKLWEKDVKEDPETHRRYKLAKSVDDVGHVTARIVAVELPADLDRSTRQLLAYSGTVPRSNQSGNKELPPQIWGGNAHLRTGLYMASMNSVFLRGKRNQPFYEAIYKRNLLPHKRGVAHKKAIVAVMRKILANIIAVIKRNTPWTSEPPVYRPLSAVPTAPLQPGT